MAAGSSDKAGARERGSAKQKEWDNAAAVDEFMARLDHPIRTKMEMVRSIILSADPRITEGIKWNAPSFYHHVWFATFNRSPKAKDLVQLIFHRGAKAKPGEKSRYVEDPSGILEWITNDRCLARFEDLKDIEAKKDALRAVVAQWVNRLTAEAKSA